MISVIYTNRYSSGKVEVSDLTWEQKERVLRYLFARMNGGSSKEERTITSAPVLPAIEHRHSATGVTKDDMKYVAILFKSIHTFVFSFHI